MNRIAVKVAYLGEGFSGSQKQPGLRTVEGEIESNLKTICGTFSEENNLKMASRTDGGVNALGNVACFETSFGDPEKLLRALNAVSDGVFYRSYSYVPDDFNVRYAYSRSYRYVAPLKGIDIGRAKECASLFEGEHDFAGFCKYDGKSTVASIDSVSVRTDGDLIFLDFEAKFFLWNQVRRMTAAIFSVGRGDSEIESVRECLNGGPFSFGVSPAEGLTLTDVRYRNVTFTEPKRRPYGNAAEKKLLNCRLKGLFYESL
ncbi:MAG: tRNA pseudouridine synthase A [Candidatus Methanomethylophilaceae archaeon]|jgi:tRNA pseudouridine38-40 synthase